MLDAYAIRKAIPRIVLAVIGINLSIYLCVAAVDIVNVVAQGIGGLIVGPFSTAGMTVFEVKTDPANGIAAGLGVAVGAGPMAAATTAAYTAIATQGLAVVTGALGSLLTLLAPIICLAIAILVTVVIRQALLFFLIVVSPIAIACYILPGTEKYFSKWWDLFLKTLLVYPIIALMFALSDVFASIIMSTNSGGLTGIAKIVTGIIVIYAPLFLIPFAFRFAGGAMSTLVKAASGAGDRMAKSGFVKSRREFYGQANKDTMTRARAEAYRRASSSADQNAGLRGRSAAWRARKISGYRSDILDREADLNKRQSEAQAAVSGNGDDSLVRAYTVNKSLADGQKTEGDLWRYKRDANGVSTGAKEYRSAGGSWQSESSVTEAQRKYGSRNVSQLQQSLAYEMRKAATQEQQDSVVRNFAETADAWGMSENQTNGAWIGAGFANQDSNLQWKHGRWSRDSATGEMKMAANEASIIKEMDEKKGSYEAGRMNADTWTTMGKGVKAASEGKQAADATIASLESKTTLDDSEKADLRAAYAQRDTHNDTLQRASRIVDSVRTFQEDVGPDGKPTGRGKVESIGAGAAGRTKEEMRAFAKITDQYAGEYTKQSDGYARPAAPNRPEGHVEDAIYDRQAGRDGRTK